MDFVVPSSVGVVVTLLQFTLPTLFVFCCNVNPAEGDGQKINAVFVLVCRMLNKGAPGVWTAESKLQNPPVTVKMPPAIVPPASG